MDVLLRIGAGSARRREARRCEGGRDERRAPASVRYRPSDPTDTTSTGTTARSTAAGRMHSTSGKSIVIGSRRARLLGPAPALVACGGAPRPRGAGPRARPTPRPARRASASDGPAGARSSAELGRGSPPAGGPAGTARATPRAPSARTATATGGRRPQATRRPGDPPTRRSGTRPRDPAPPPRPPRSAGAEPPDRHRDHRGSSDHEHGARRVQHAGPKRDDGGSDREQRRTRSAPGGRHPSVGRRAPRRTACHGCGALRPSTSTVSAAAPAPASPRASSDLPDEAQHPPEAEPVEDGPRRRGRAGRRPTAR